MSTMIKVDLNVALLTIEGKDFENDTVGKILANRLYNSEKGDSVKYFDWALKLWQKEVIDMDSSDLDGLIEFVKEEKLPNFAEAQILRSLKKLQK